MTLYDLCVCGARKMCESQLCVSCNNKRRARPVDDRFWEKVVDSTSADRCWLWLGSHNSRGYATFHRGKRDKVLAHRFVYELVVGPIPDGLQIDHLCGNKGCVNPAHLEPVTPSENMLRGYAARRLAA